MMTNDINSYCSDRTVCSLRKKSACLLYKYHHEDCVCHECILKTCCTRICGPRRKQFGLIFEQQLRNS